MVNRSVTRRAVLGGLGGLVLAGGAGLGVRAWQQRGATGPDGPFQENPLVSGLQQLKSEIPLPARYRLPLVVPPVLTPTVDGPRDRYEITQKVATQEIVPGLRTQIWGYDGRFPGPTIVSRRGRPTVVRHRNELPVPTVVHLHGGHTPAESDGYPTDLVLPGSGAPPVPAPSVPAPLGSPSGSAHHGAHDPGAVVTTLTRDYTYPMEQPAATLWYHDHRMDFTGPSVWRGLAGFHLVRDDEEERLPLPGADRELPLMIVDRAFAADGSLSYPALDPDLIHTPGVQEPYTQGVLGDVTLVNGVPWPVHEVTAVRYRLRILNASNARVYDLALRAPNGPLPIVQIGSDGGLLATPVRHDSLTVAPAERFDVVVDFSGVKPGQLVELVNLAGSGPTASVMAFRVTASARDDSAVPDTLAVVEPVDPSSVTVHRAFDFHRGTMYGWTINGQYFDPTAPVFDTTLGTAEIWTFTSDYHHPVHVHLSSFRVLSRGGGPPGPYDAGLKDTVFVNGAEKVSVLVRFTDYPGRFLLHCHNLEHEDMAMMATFRVR
ncbi:multicopper oxidase domain-containing protein [Dactylosporangium sp. NPDC051485]|uniref:multicopper oxidase family protein n=1 Tax=Dactylosporangium sp. NPDC051485 TaxID=3154846 RepID=UPI00342E31D0